MKYITYIIIITSVFFLLLSKSYSTLPFWELVSMTPPRGIIQIIDRYGNNIYTSGSGGIFISSDNGENWSWFLSNNRVGIIVIDSIIFTRGHNAINGIDSFGIYKSIDNGKTWIDITGPWDRRFTAYKFVHDSNKIYSVINSDTGNNKIYYTSNEGKDWLYCSELNMKGDIWDYNNFFPDGNVFIATAESADRYSSYFFISKDYGKSWKSKYFKQNNIHDVIIKSKQEYYISTDNGIWFTSDYGETWKLKWLEGDNIALFAISKDFNKILAYIYQYGLKYSLDNGNSWQKSEIFSNINPESNPWAMNKLIDDYAFCSPFYLGLYRSDDYFYTWNEKNEGYTGSAPVDLSFINTQIYFTNWGLFKSSNDGKTFDYLGLKSFATGGIAVSSKGDIFVGDLGTGNTAKGIFKSTDGGNTWKDINPGAMSIDAILVNSKDYIFVAPGYRSTDNGETWQDLIFECRLLAINDEGHIFAFSYGNIYKSTDDGISWENQVSVQPDPTFIESGGKIIFNNKTKTAAYSFLSRNLDSCCFITTDNGRSWQLNRTGLYSTTSQTSVVDSMYCWVQIRNGGIYRSCDNGLSWQKMDSNGLKHKDFGPIGVSPDGHIYVFGSTGGLYRSRDAFVSVKEEKQPIKDELYNTPNPFSKTTEITVSLSRAANLKLTVFDIMGNKLESHNYGWQEPGETTILFDGDKYPSGVYFYRLDMSGEAKTRVMVLEK